MQPTAWEAMLGYTCCPGPTRPLVGVLSMSLQPKQLPHTYCVLRCSGLRLVATLHLHMHCKLSCTQQQQQGAGRRRRRARLLSYINARRGSCLYGRMGFTWYATDVEMHLVQPAGAFPAAAGLRGPVAGTAVKTHRIRLCSRLTCCSRAAGCRGRCGRPLS